MKKLHYFGLTALTMLFSFGFASANGATMQDDPETEEITVTVSPAPEDGAVDEGQKITITVTPAGADVYYDMYASLDDAKDGFPMSEVSSEGNPTVTAAKPVLAVYVETSDDDKTVYFVYTVNAGSTDPEEPAQPDAPTVNKISGAYVTGTQITVSKGDADKLLVVTGKTAAAIAEATDFTEYTADYTITLTQDTAIRAYAMKGERKSEEVTRAYTMKQTISFAFDPAPGEVEENTEIRVTVTPEPKDIYFSMFADREDAEAESMLDYIYGEDEDGFPKVTKNKTVLKVIARFEDNSQEESYAEYTIKGAAQVPDTVKTPKFDVEPGVVDKGKKIEISCATIGSKIYYTVNGGDPTTESTLYTDEISIDSTMTLKAIAVKEGMVNSQVATATYTIQSETPEEVPAPVFTPDAGAVDSNSTVTILKGTADSIFVTFGKNLTFTRYTADLTVTIVRDTTIRAYAMKDGNMSQTVTKNYTLKPASTVADTVKTPTFSPLAGQVEKGTKVTIASATEGATIHYTVDGSEPTAESPEYTAEISIDSALTLKAIAVKEGMVNSQVAEASYTIKQVSNEDRELAGVRLYPNPTEAEFNLVVPATADVEIFNASGILVRQLVAEGTAKIRLENSGMYFVRVRANGQATIQKIIVR